MTQEDLYTMMTEFSKRFEEMDQAFKTMEERIANESKWETHTLVLPKRIGKRWYWPGRTVYRKYTFSPGGGFYRYGTEFDVLKDSK